MTRFLNRRRTSASRSPVLVSSAALFVLLVIVAVVSIHWFVTQRTEAVADQLLVGVSDAFQSVRPFRNADAVALRQYPNRFHVERARELGIPRIPDREAAERMLESENMVRLEDSPYYIVLDLGYSVPYVTRDAAHLLDIIGQRFQARLAELGLPRYRYVVTSATRTDDDQRRLRRVNANAAENSSHFHGTTVDIHYARFNYVVAGHDVPTESGLSRPLLEERLRTGYTEMIEEHHPKLKAVLATVMREIQDAGYVLVIYERMQPVYHITVNRRIAEPAVERVLEELPLLAVDVPPDDVSGDDLDFSVVAPAR